MNEDLISVMDDITYYAWLFAAGVFDIKLGLDKKRAEPVFREASKKLKERIDEYKKLREMELREVWH
jgi:hypothetical protein